MNILLIPGTLAYYPFNKYYQIETANNMPINTNQVLTALNIKK